eukprot:SAG31_NODE_15269_length_763_cov_0.969880_1_plen_129_part_10
MLAPTCASRCALRYGVGTANACACTFGCESAAAGQNFEECQHTCDTQCDDAGECTGESKKQPALGTVFKCCKCCLCCIEKFVEVVNKYAYVYVAMESCSFCAGAKKSFALIREYPIQMVVMKAINWFVL